MDPWRVDPWLPPVRWPCGRGRRSERRPCPSSRLMLHRAAYAHPGIGARLDVHGQRFHMATPHHKTDPHSSICYFVPPSWQGLVKIKERQGTIVRTERASPCDKHINVSCFEIPWLAETKQNTTRCFSPICQPTSCPRQSSRLGLPDAPRPISSASA